MNNEDICFKFIDGELKEVYHVSNKLHSVKLTSIRDYINEVIE